MPSHARHASKPSHTKNTVNSIEFTQTDKAKLQESVGSKVCSLWIHDDTFSKEDVLFNLEVLGQDTVKPGDLVEIISFNINVDTHDFTYRTETPSKSSKHADLPKDGLAGDSGSGQLRASREEGKHNPKSATHDAWDDDGGTRYVFIAKPMPEDIKAQHPTLQVSVTNAIASTFGFGNRSQVVVSAGDRDATTATHVEIRFRDEYLARSDMWRLIISELAGKTVYRGQKILFLGTIKAVIKTIYISGQKATSAYFSTSTIPIFRSESARYVLFIQMSKEMWDFDSEGTGEILFSRVIDGFLPELFKRWADLEAKHLVSIVMFGKLEYDRPTTQLSADHLQTQSMSGSLSSSQDFYRVVVSDMSSGQWRSILNELKKEFRVFLRDISLESVSVSSLTDVVSEAEDVRARPTICGRPSSALRGNILEAINIASYHYATDYLDRDLVRTGISVVVITAGTGVFEVDHGLLDLTSEGLTNNGMGIDLVCLSKMPLHSVPLFKYRSPTKMGHENIGNRQVLLKTPSVPTAAGSLSSQKFGVSPAPSTIYGSTPKSMQKSSPITGSNEWCYGIPQWIDVSYWAPDSISGRSRHGLYSITNRVPNDTAKPSKTFVPRVRMYELQMMGVMELGLANISIPYLSEGVPPRLNLRTGSIIKSNGPSHGLHSATNSWKSLTGSFGRRESALKTRPAQKSILSGQARRFRSTFDRMDEYDAKVFTLGAKRERSKNLGRTMNHGRRIATGAKSKSSPPKRPLNRIQHGKGSPNKEKRPALEENGSSGTGKHKVPHAQRPSIGTHGSSSRISRSISFALRGLGTAPPRAVASTEINIAHAKAETPTKAPISRRPLVQVSESIVIPETSSQTSKVRQSIDPDHEENSDLTAPLVDSKLSPSRPISIQKPGPNLRESEKEDTSGTDHSFSTIVTTIHERQDDGLPTVPKGQPPADSRESDRSRETISASRIAWVRNVNPSNPEKNDPSLAASFGRWQHVFPKAPRTSVVKWRSLCTPAAVPLTTEEFPSKQALENDYVETPYSVWQYDEREVQEVAKTREHLLREMVALRMSHGYQVVLGSETANPGEFWPVKTPCIFDTASLAEEGATVFMSMGNTIQRLQCVGSAEIQVTRYVRKSLAAHRAANQSVQYIPRVKTILSQAYLSRKMTIAGFSREYPWNLADSYLAGHYDHSETVVERLRFWRARFVLIPVEAPTNARRFMPATAMTQDNEEEIHILGIRQLAQMWQRLRFVPPEEQWFKPTRRKKDPNPLDITFSTMNPSRVVAGEMDRTLLAEGASQSTQLLPESELFSRSNLNLANLVQTMQGEKGVDIATRRWHWRLHANCFIGDAMTTWLLENFRDIETRQEAVEFGNELMDRGVFQHVDKRHNFRDGMYYYQFGPEYAPARPESRHSWLPGRRTDKSVPSTPAVEPPTRNSPLRSRSQSGSDLQKAMDEGDMPTPTKQSKNRMSICLSKLMRVDIDIRKRSNRPEIVELHYDRLHNPENCYHLELAWLNVTSKLVEDAIVSWATTAEKYGLKLVEVPIAEASSVSAYGPFRTPSVIELKLQPPSTTATPLNYFTGPSFPVQPAEMKYHYQKALLKHFDFVLDVEAASDFPPDVNVTYSWGKQGYQHPQFIHKSGVLLAQITEDGNFLLLANRLYNTRSAAGMDILRFETNHSNAANARRPVAQGTASSTMATSHPLTPGAVSGGNLSPHLSPLVRATPDVLGPHALSASGLKTYTSPEQIRHDLEAFCSDTEKLGTFYESALPRKMSSSSSAIQPVKNVDGLPEIPEIKLPASVVATPGSDRPGVNTPRSGRASPRSQILREDLRPQSEKPSNTTSNSGTSSRKASSEEKHP